MRAHTKLSIKQAQVHELYGIGSSALSIATRMRLIALSVPDFPETMKLRKTPNTKLKINKNMKIN